MKDTEPITKSVELRSGSTRAKVSPNGALVTNFTVGGIEVLMPDQICNIGGKPKKRGGVPIFNIAGLQHQKQGIFKLDIDQHGFVRNKKWKVEDHTNDQVTLSLTDDVETREQFPYAFHTEMKVTLKEKGIRWNWSTKNNGRLDDRMNADMPSADALHPYVSISKKKLQPILLALIQKRTGVNQAV